MQTTVINNAHQKRGQQSVYIGRPSKWGNPFKIGIDGDRATVVALYRQWITEGEGRHLLADLHELRGKQLVCFCAPLACHGDVLAELADAGQRSTKQE